LLIIHQLGETPSIVLAFEVPTTATTGVFTLPSTFFIIAYTTGEEIARGCFDLSGDTRRRC
jgi:hypothetical protein